MKILQDTLQSLSLGAPQHYRNLSMFPLVANANKKPDYLVLDEALERQMARITEVSQQGSVPELQFTNQADRAVLLLDGEELLGAKQNRVLNLTLLIPAQTSLKIPVSCVEAGRWQHQSAEFKASPRTYYSSGRAKKLRQVTACMTETGCHYSDQQAVWADIAEKASRLRTSSPTGAMAAMYENHQHSLEDYVLGLSLVNHQVGALFAINGQLIGLDLFDFPATMDKLFAKLVRSYALDALDHPNVVTDASTSEQARGFLQTVVQSKSESFPALGEGTDLRLEGSGLVGSALIARDRIVHLSAFRLQQSPSSSSSSFRSGNIFRRHHRRQP